jgi:hypothetical protein
MEAAVRCYHGLQTLPLGGDARLEDVRRVFGLAEKIVVLGEVKTPISLQGKLINSGVGPHVLAIAGVAFSWCLRVVCRLVSAGRGTEAGEDELALEYYRRKMLDYVRMCGPYCMFAGGGGGGEASLRPLSLRVALHFHQSVSFAARMGPLGARAPGSPARAPPGTLAAEADALVELVRDLGVLGYVLASTSPRDAAHLLAS